MKIRIAIIAACASTFVLAQADVVRANYGAASEPSASEVILAERQNQENAAVRFAYSWELTASTDEKTPKKTKRDAKQISPSDRSKTALPRTTKSSVDGRGSGK